MITTVLDLLGSLFFIAGIAWWVGIVLGLWGAFCAAGLLLLGLSWFIDRPDRKLREKRAKEEQ